MKRTDEDDAAIGQALINLIPEEESLPDDRSRRNVRNRFRIRLPERAFWREDGWDPGGDRDRDADIAEHEERFGRYYDDDGNINIRGRVVNEQLRAERDGKPMITERRPDDRSPPGTPPGEGRTRNLYGPVPEFEEGRDWGEQAEEWTNQQRLAWLDADGLGPPPHHEVPSHRRAVERALFDDLVSHQEGDVRLKNGSGYPLNRWSELELRVAERRMAQDRHIERMGGEPLMREIQAELGRRRTAPGDLPPGENRDCLLYTSPSPRDLSTARMPSSA